MQVSSPSKLNSTDLLGVVDSPMSRPLSVALASLSWTDLLEISGGGYEQPAMTGVAVAKASDESWRRVPLPSIAGLPDPRTLHCSSIPTGGLRHRQGWSRSSR